MSDFVPSVARLSPGDGHMEIKLVDATPADLARAKTVVETMIRSGCAVFVETADGKTRRAIGFDEKALAYRVADDVPAEGGGTKKGVVSVPMKEAKATGTGLVAGG